METESQPWSKSSPRGVLDFVLLACFPSMASSDWYRNRPSAARSNAQAGSWKHRLNSVFKTGCQQCYHVEFSLQNWLPLPGCLLLSWWIQSLKLAVKTVKVPFVIMMNSVFKTGCQQCQCLLSSWWIQSLKLAVNSVSVFCHHDEFSL